MFETEVVEPKIWTYEEAYRSGKGGFKIKVGLDGNPFRGDLANAWVRGWKEAAASEPIVQRRSDFSEDKRERRPYPKTKFNIHGDRDNREKRW